MIQDFVEALNLKVPPPFLPSVAESRMASYFCKAQTTQSKLRGPMIAGMVLTFVCVRTYWSAKRLIVIQLVGQLVSTSSG